MEPITLPFHGRPSEPEYKVLIHLPDLHVRANINVETSVVYETLKKFVFDDNTQQGLGEPTIAWMEFAEKVIHPDDWIRLQKMNLSIGQLETIAGALLRQLSFMGTEGAEQALA